MTIGMAKVWNITTLVLGILAVVILIRQIQLLNVVGILAFGAIVCIIFGLRWLERC